ncbi:MAG: AAA family ATPase [Chloroflexota bacterium]|nr:AAA family ATPase [Chloroflexota bacterium]
MRITRLTITDMRRNNVDITLAPGVTVVRGPNEAGKTTIQRAIELVLTRKATSNMADLDALRPWGGSEEARPVIAIEFVQEDEDKTWTGRLEKAFRGAKGTVQLELDGSTTTDPNQADHALAELTGLPTEAFFRATASVRHHEVDDLQRDEGALRDRLQASISGADRGTSRARKKLEKALLELNTKGAKNPGRLKIAEAAVEQEQTAVDQGDVALTQLERDRDTLAGARERRTAADSALRELRAMLEKARTAERLTAERENARARFERYRDAVATRDEIAELHENHPSPNPLPVLRQIVERLRGLDVRIRELRGLLAGEVSVDFDVPPEPTWRPLSRIAIVMVVIGLLLAVGAFVASLARIAPFGQMPLIVGGVVAVVGLILAAVAFQMRRGERLSKELRDMDIDRRLRGRSQIEEDLRQSEFDYVAQLQTLELPDIASAEAQMAAEEEHINKIGRLTAHLEGLVGRESPDTLPVIRDAAALEVEQKGHALESIGPIAREPRARERLEVEVHDAEIALEKARDEEANTRARVEANAVDAEQVAGHAERLAAWREQLAALQRRARVYQGTLTAIERADQATIRTATRFLEKRMVVDLDRVTAGRYKRVKVDDKTLDISVFAPEKGDWVPVSTLSQGTLDLVYLAARLGLVRLVTGDRRPPLVFDDPFVTLDDARAVRALELLREIAADFQVIYLTTSDRYDSAADSVVELPGPTAVDTPKEPQPAAVDA